MGGGGRRAAQVLARVLTRVRFFPLEQVPKSARRSALGVQLQAWTPFPDSAYAIVWRESGALVFAWDSVSFLRRAEAAGLPTDGVTVVPETLLLPSQAEGFSLQRCEVGCVAQYWQGGLPLQSRWWPAWPHEEEWLNFQRSVGMTGAVRLPLPHQPEGLSPWLERPWATPAGVGALHAQGRLWEHAAMGALTLLLLAPTLWLARDWLESGGLLERVDARKAELVSRVRPIVQAREQTEAALNAGRAIATQIDHPDGLALLAHISRLLPQDGSVLRELEWQGRRLHLSLATPAGSSRSAYIKALESGQWLRDVREASGSAPGAFAVTAVIVGSAPPSRDSDRAPTPLGIPVPTVPGRP